MFGQTDKFKIGLFVVAALAIAVIVLIWLGASRFLSPSQTAVAYFNETVQGLEPDSPVKFMGVTVGRVKAISLVPGGRLVEVKMGLDESFELSDDLSIQIGFKGLTGLKYLDMKRFRKGRRPKPPQLTFEPEYPVIPAKRSDIENATVWLDKILREVNPTDIRDIATNLLNITDKLDRALADERIDTIGADAADAVAAFKKTAKKLNTEIDRMRLSKRVAKTLDKSSDLMDEATVVTRSADKMVRRAENHVNEIGRKLNTASKNFVVLSERMKNTPLRTLFGYGKDEGEKK